MRSALPKVLHPVCGVSMGAHVIGAARAVGPERLVVVVGHGGDEVRAALDGPGVTFVEQAEQLGTGDAVRQCRAALAGCDTIVVLNGDQPLVTSDLLTRLLAARGQSPFAFVTSELDEPGRLGRVQRRGGSVNAIVEAADDPGADGPAEVNAGKYVFDAEWLWERLDRLEPAANGEFYLTSLARMAAAEGSPAVTVSCAPEEFLGVDDRLALSEAERLMRQRILANHMRNGVTITDPVTTYIDASVVLGEDATVMPNSHLYGTTSVAPGARIGPGTTLQNADIGPGSVVRHSVVEDSRVGARVSIGPFAHIRGNAEIGDECELGNYAEVKNSVLGRGVKMHHFSYVGDADVGEDSNMGAGMITCNFDGEEKHRTIIGKRVFVGSDTMLVAPITLGDGASTGAGSVVTRDVPADTKVVGVPAREFPARDRGDDGA